MLLHDLSTGLLILINIYGVYCLPFQNAAQYHDLCLISAEIIKRGYLVDLVVLGFSDFNKHGTWPEMFEKQPYKLCSFFNE